MKKLYYGEMYTDNEGEITEGVFIVDGYHVDDRFFEGFEFQATLQNGEIVDAAISQEDLEGEFLSNFKIERLLEKIKNTAQREIMFDDTVNIPQYLKNKYFKNENYIAFFSNNG